MHYEIRHLKAFVAVAEELNFHHAAARLGMTQPAVSRIVSELEQRLNVRLLERTTRMVRLTEPGRYLLAEAQDVLGRLRSAADNVRSIAQGTRAILKIGFTTINGHALVPDILQAFNAANPDVRVELIYAAAPVQRDRIITGDLDGGFMEGSFESAEVSTAVAARHSLMAIMPSAHPLATRETLTITDIVDEPLILGRSEDWPTMRRIISDAFLGEGKIVANFQEAPTLTILLGMVAAGMGIMIFSGVPRFMGGGLVARPVETAPPIFIETHLVWRRANTNVAFRRFRDVAKHVARKNHYLS